MKKLAALILAAALLFESLKSRERSNRTERRGSICV